LKGIDERGGPQQEQRRGENPALWEAGSEDPLFAGHSVDLHSYTPFSEPLPAPLDEAAREAQLEEASAE